MLVGHAWPILCARASAWVRSPGFHQSSRNTTVLAALSVMPACNSSIFQYTPLNQPPLSKPAVLTHPHLAKD